MAPDLNTLPASPPTSSARAQSPAYSQRPRRSSLTNNADAFRPGPPSPMSPPLSSLQAAATINSSLHRSPSNSSPIRTTQGMARRRSSLMINFSINDPTVPAPGEMQQPTGSNSSSPRIGRRSIALGTADPNHHRQPSLGELHQELENEQESQVNRLLHLIRIQQDQLAAFQRQQQEASPTSIEQPAFPTAPSTLPTPAGANVTEQSSPRSGSISGLPHATHAHLNRPHSLSRQSSARLSNTGTSSRNGSPALRPVSANLGPLTEGFLLGDNRDECAFYQAETQTLTRENHMLKMRIRELERQVSDMASPTSPAGGITTAGLAHSAAQNSPLASPPATFTSEAAPPLSAPMEPTAKVD